MRGHHKSENCGSNGFHGIQVVVPKKKFVIKLNINYFNVNQYGLFDQLNRYVWEKSQGLDNTSIVGV